MKSISLCIILLASVVAPAVSAAEIYECAEGVCAGAGSSGSCDSAGVNGAFASVDRPEASASVLVATICSESTNGAGVFAEYETPQSVGIASAQWIDSYGFCVVGGYGFIQAPIVGLVPFAHTAGCPLPPPTAPVAEDLLP